MAAPNRTNSNASTLTVLSDDFAERVRDNIEGKLSTPTIVRKARAHLREFKQDPSRHHRHPSTLISNQHLDPHALIEAMLDCAANEQGQRYVAYAIVTCLSETSLLVDLANTWLRYLLLVFKGNSDKRGGADASEQATPTLDETEIYLDSIPTSRPESFRRDTLQRDGYQCALSGWYDRTSMRVGVAAGSLGLLETAHILRRAVATFDDRQSNSAYATWDIIRQYAHWPDKTLQDMINLIDTPENGFILESNLHDAFDDFIWTLVPETTPNGRVLPHTYRVKVMDPNAMPTLPFKHVVTFQNREPPEGLKVVLEAKLHPLPNPKFLALHAALAQVFHMSGAGQVIDLYMDRSSRDGHALPSDKIRHGDELAIRLSQMTL